MVRFRRYVVSEGDTLQAISQRMLGDMNRWTEIAETNNLRHPYIVDSVEEKMENPDHLVTIGDTVLIEMTRSEEENVRPDPSNLARYDKEEIFALSLGKDLDILPEPLDRDTDMLQLKGDNRGSIKTVRGVENLKQSLFVRLITPKGGYVGHPNFGSDIHKILGKKNNEETAALLDIEIERTLRTDGRVSHVELLDRNIYDNVYVASFLVRAVDLEEAFEFVVSTREDGLIVLLDNFNDVRSSPI